MAEFWILVAPAADVRHVQLGSTVTLGCNISYLYDTIWLKHNPDLTPTVVLGASLTGGQLVQGFQLSPRFSVGFMNRSLALMISDIEEGDLGLYYCVGHMNTHLKVGTGTRLQVSSPGSSLSLFYHWYCVIWSCVLLTMVLCVCFIHWKTRVKVNRKTTS